MRLSQAICAGSHWLTHLEAGNTPIPTYPCIQVSDLQQNSDTQRTLTLQEHGRYLAHFTIIQFEQSAFELSQS